ncbi:MAG: MaoC/PaaZ C-terminal domain-containing protein [Clostridiales bacterium]
MYFEDFCLGLKWEMPAVLIDKEQVFAFARDYDPLPLHSDEAYAKTTQFNGLVAPGVMTFMLVWAEFVKMNLWGDNMVAGQSTNIKWIHPVYVGDVLTGWIHISDAYRGHKPWGTVEYTVEVYNQQGVQVILNQTKMVIKARC